MSFCCGFVVLFGFFLNYSWIVGGHLLSGAVVRTPHLPVCWSCQKVAQREPPDLWARRSAQRLAEEVGALELSPPAPFKAGESGGVGLLPGAAAQMRMILQRERGARPAETGCSAGLYRQRERKRTSREKISFKIGIEKNLEINIDII